MPPDIMKDMIKQHLVAYEAPVNETPTIPSEPVRKLRRDLITEEFVELMDALYHDNMEGIADGAVDLIVVVVGTLLSYGIDFNMIWRAVHTANMAKAGGPVREDGKRLKPPDWKPPDIKTLLENQAPLLAEEEDVGPLAPERTCKTCGKVLQYPYIHTCVCR